MSAASGTEPRFRSLPVAARAYVSAVVVGGACSLSVALWHVRLEQVGLFAALMTLAVAISAVKIELPFGRSQSNLSLSPAVNFWALFALAPGEAVCIAAVSAWAQCRLRVDTQDLPHRVLFSVASLVVTVSVTAVPVTLLPDASTIPGLIRTAAIVSPLYFFLNSGLMAGAIALSTGQVAARVWHRNFLWSGPNYLAGAVLAAFAVAASARGWTGWLALLAVPLYLSHHTIGSRLREEQDATRQAMDVQLATIEALALAIEAKSGSTPRHIQSIQQYAATLGEAVGLSEVDVQAVRTAALLHDVGNMAVPEHILSKPGPLTSEEFERVKIHPRVGAEILCHVPFGAPVAELVLYHHERWDGLGYPSGLRGEAIPLGARILAIADCYSTLQTERPYRKARSEAEAAAVLRDFAGTSFDPALVDAFIDRLRPSSAGLVAGAAPPDDAWNRVEGGDALMDIAGTHREEQALYEIAQALGSSLGIDDAMTLIQQKVRRLVPFVTCALFLGDEREGYACRVAHGPGTEALFKWGAKSWSDISLRLPVCADGRDAHGEELLSLLPCPLMFEGRLIGGLVLYHSVPGAFTDEHRRVFARVSEQTAAVIFNATRFEQTEYDSHTDVLTGLANRRSLDRQFESGLARAAESEGAISVVVLDLDRLKEINDTYGHEAGDRALLAVGTVLRSTVRKNDLCARFAGDEFVVLLWDCSPDYETRRVVELQAAISAYPFEPRPGVVVSLSISAGVARFPVDGQSFEELLAAADERMYHDKASHRSRGSSRQAVGRQERA